MTTNLIGCLSTFELRVIQGYMQLSSESIEEENGMDLCVCCKQDWWDAYSPGITQQADALHHGDQQQFTTEEERCTAGE